MKEFELQLEQVLIEHFYILHKDCYSIFESATKTLYLLLNSSTHYAHYTFLHSSKSQSYSISKRFIIKTYFYFNFTPTKSAPSFYSDT